MASLPHARRIAVSTNAPLRPAQVALAIPLNGASAMPRLQAVPARDTRILRCRSCGAQRHPFRGWAFCNKCDPSRHNRSGRAYFHAWELVSPTEEPTDA